MSLDDDQPMPANIDSLLTRIEEQQESIWELEEMVTNLELERQQLYIELKEREKTIEALEDTGCGFVERIQELHLELISTLGQFEQHVPKDELTKYVKQYDQGVITRNELASFMIKLSGWEPPGGWVILGKLLSEDNGKELTECPGCKGTGAGLNYFRDCIKCNGTGLVLE